MTLLLGSPAPAAIGETVRIDAADLRCNNYRADDEPRAQRLAVTMSGDGRQQFPCLVSWDADAAVWELVDGHHRRRSCEILGWDVVCLVVEYAAGGVDALAAAMSANLTGARSTIVEDALGFGRLVDAGWTVEEIAARMGMLANTVRARLELLELDPAARIIVTGTAGGATYHTPLLGLPHDVQRELARQLSARGWTRPQWSAACDDYRRAAAERAAAEDSFFGADFGLAVEEWSTDRGAYLADLAAPPAELPPAAPVRERVLGLADLADHVGAKRQTAYKWQSRGQLPPHDLTVSGGPAWYLSTVDAWQATKK